MSSVSAYVPSVRFRDEAWSMLRRQWLQPRVDAFFRPLGDQPRWEVPAHESIVDSDFDYKSNGGVPFKYFYEVLLHGVKKRNGEVIGVGYTFTFDKDMVGLSEKSSVELGLDKKTGFYFSTVLLAGEPVFYYLYVDMQEAIRRIKEIGSRDLAQAASKSDRGDSSLSSFSARY